MKLTQRAVDAIGLDGDRVVWDDEIPGLGVRVQSGRRTWIVRYRVATISAAQAHAARGQLLRFAQLTDDKWDRLTARGAN